MFDFILNLAFKKISDLVLSTRRSITNFGYFRFVGFFILSGQAKHRLMQCWLPQFYLPIMRLIESIRLKQIWLSKWRLWPFSCLFCVLGHWFVTMATTAISHTKKWYASDSSDPTLTIACKKRSGLSLKPIKRPKSVLPAPFNVSQFSLHVKVKNKPFLQKLDGFLLDVFIY